MTVAEQDALANRYASGSISLAEFRTLNRHLMAKLKAAPHEAEEAAKEAAARSAVYEEQYSFHRSWHELGHTDAATFAERAVAIEFGDLDPHATAAAQIEMIWDIYAIKRAAELASTPSEN